ncbi:hypothetical protein BDV95DRAFT_581111 [Massariosphaeria phaeospora]|uniref:Nascent polypeptide-associated complex subunit alpha-like UBA domain-containing protein n=1 Tax=Massariosphaeria phaeospora TaxID=100035 RepID=A0A7C8I319_9PLEO|nr:hypothetical protein BDV95DRAFT_581111 [Massariosphaeria phaeospora]
MSDSSSSGTPISTPPPESPATMAEEPQPSTIHEGAADPHAPTGTAEDRKAAAALSSLDTQDDDATGKKETDSKALGEAMKNLRVQDAGAAEKKKTVKVEPADIALLVSELELSKAKATELLRAHDGSAVQAMTSFITPAFA